MDFLKQSIAEEFDELRNLEFTYHENDDDNIDEDSLKSDDDERNRANPTIKDGEIKKKVKNIKISKKKIKDETPKSAQKMSYSINKNEENEDSSESEQEHESELHFAEEEEEEIEVNDKPFNFVFDTTELQDIMDMKCINFIDDIVLKEVAKRRLNMNTIESAVINKPILNFTNYFSKEVLPLYPSAAMEKCDFDFLNVEMDKSLDGFLNKLLCPKDEIKNKKGKNERNKNSQSKHKHHHHHHRRRPTDDIPKKVEDKSNNGSDDEAFNQAEA